jgi:hypothetical protein
MKIHGKQLYVSIQCSCIDINMAELRESGESMQFLKVIAHANARLTIGEIIQLMKPYWFQTIPLC